MNLRLCLIYGVIILLVLLRVILTPPPQALPDGAHIHARIRLTSTPQFVSGKQQIQVTLKGQKVTLVTSPFSEYNYGDLLDVTGTLKAKALSGERIVYSISFPKISVIQDDTALPYKLAGFVRARVAETYTTFLDPDQASLLEGIVFGINSSVDKRLKSAFQVTGVTHVIAASGMNVTLLAAFLLPLLTRFLKRQTSLVVLIMILMFYALLSGMSASIVRATLMASIGYIGLLLGRQRTAFISFFLTGCIMIGITPSVLTDIGFQLSFAATAGMLVIQPLFPNLEGLPLVTFVEEDLKATLAAQITTLPILIYYFHTLGVLAILVNVLVLWTIAPLMVIGSIAAFVGLVSTALGGLITLLTLPLLSYFLFVVKFFARITPVLTLSDLPLILVIGYYLCISALILFFHKRKQRHAANL